MTEPSNPITSLPSRPLNVEEVAALAETDRFDAAFYDDAMAEVIGIDQRLVAYNAILITGDRVSAVVFIEDDETWSRVYNETRADAVLTEAYEAVREVRGYDDLFDRHALTVEEAVFETGRPTGEETSGYEEGDTFSCPVCRDDHEVKFHEDEYAADNKGLDSSYLYVECSEAQRNELVIEYQASTPS